MCIIIKQVHTQIISQILSVYNTVHMTNHFARNVNYMSNRKCTNCRADFNSENYECPPSLHSKVHDKWPLTTGYFVLLCHQSESNISFSGGCFSASFWCWGIPEFPSSETSWEDWARSNEAMLPSLCLLVTALRGRPSWAFPSPPSW